MATMNGQYGNYQFFIEEGKRIVQNSGVGYVSSENRRANAELAKACAMLADACKTGRQ